MSGAVAAPADGRSRPTQRLGSNFILVMALSSGCVILSRRRITGRAKCSLLQQMRHLDQLDTFTANAWRLSLQDIVHTQQLAAVFQPILDMQQGTVIGFEGLIRGPANSQLHSPVDLFRVARHCGMIADVEHLACRSVLESFAGMDFPGRIFLNVSPDVLRHKASQADTTLKFIKRLGLRPEQIVIEITENMPTVDYPLLRETTQHYRSMGFAIAIDDLGEGFSGLRLWSEISPQHVKIDQHFIHNIHLDPVKLQFVRSIQEIAAKTGASVIAEGIESAAELAVIRDLGIAYGQGYFIARPAVSPPREVSEAIRLSLIRGKVYWDRQLSHWSWNRPAKTTVESSRTRAVP